MGEYRSPPTTHPIAVTGSVTVHYRKVNKYSSEYAAPRHFAKIRNQAVLTPARILTVVAPEPRASAPDCVDRAGWGCGRNINRRTWARAPKGGDEK